MRRGGVAAFFVCILAALPAWAGEAAIPLYYDHLQFNLTSPGAYETAIGGYANPAIYGMLRGGEAQFSWTDTDNSFTNLKEWGAFLGGSGVGLGAVRDVIPDPTSEVKVLDWRLGFAGGTKNVALGMGFGWTTGDKDLAGRSTIFQLGAVHRLGRYVSVGAVGNFAFEKSYQTGLFDVAVRPLGDERVALFADLEYPKGFSLKNAPWSVGAMVEYPRGLQLTGRYFEDETFSVAIGFSFGRLRASGAPRFDKGGSTTNTIYELRTGFEKPSVYMDWATKDRGYLAVNLKGDVTYRSYEYFDEGRHALQPLLADLDKAKSDPQVSGVALNLHGANMSRGKAWEIRQKLQEVKDAGKPVVVYVGAMTMTEVHLASVADRVIIDPQGIIFMKGFILGRTFMADAIEKMGLGIDEWRFFSHKSAFEIFSRTSMSEADKEQRYSLIEERYEVMRDEVMKSRNVSAETFDQWINEDLLMTPQQALDAGLVDKIGRWDDVKDVMQELEGERKGYVGRASLAENRIESTLWGEDPEIAVVYALGSCAMDTGINARRLDAILKRLDGDRNVKAVVLRVDSPGGSAEASDWVAQRLRKTMEKKPVVISQGDVAASGGYWLSMYSNKLYAQPTTITGSIGVIGGWVWDEGLGEKIGHTSDHVKIGESADFNYGFRFLLAGPMLPARNLNPTERAKVEDLFMSSYDEFVTMVSEGRGIPKDRVYELAEGRVYSGNDGKENGLIDEIGGLSAAIDMARSLASIDDDERVAVEEYPKLPWFNFAMLRPSPFGALFKVFGFRENPEPEQEPSYDWTYIRSIVESPGQPLYMLPPEYYDD